jgi:ABC-type Fe3+-hydroxamate transport system substrate-binding protein
MRLVSLVPSLTETVRELGLEDRLVGVTSYCEADAQDVGGTKNPDVAAIVALAPDLVLANSEENRLRDLDALRAAGLDVHLTFPRRVADVAPMLRALGVALGATEAAERLAQRVEDAFARAAARPRPDLPPRALVLVWRKPWMAAGADTFAADLLRCCGFAVPLDRAADRYPRLTAGDPALRDLDLVVLPSEPYVFTPADLPAVRDLVGPVPHALVDGRLLTWHGSRTATALDEFAALVEEQPSQDGCADCAT